MSNTKRVDYDGSEWEGYAEVDSITFERSNGKVTATSKHQFSATNVSTEDHNFRITYNLKLSRWLGEDHGWDDFPMVQAGAVPACDASETITHATIGIENTLSKQVNDTGGQTSYKAVAYTKVTPQWGFEEDDDIYGVTAEFTRVITFGDVG
ncbi:MAG: hypothetical protein OXT74_07970 [Candidatus Poribacteria bacterium]|nr:hypothetical protein [Candidatus Poribacteria bacterium]